MIVSHRFKFIFVKTAKTAGTSIETVLSPQCGEKDVLTPFTYPEVGHIPRNYRGIFSPVGELIDWSRGASVPNRAMWRRTLRDLARRRRFYHHIPAWMLQNRIGNDVWSTYYKFCVERNPWDKVLSGYHYYNHKYGSSLTLDHYISECERRVASGRAGYGVCPYNWGLYTDVTGRRVIVDRVLRFESLKEDLAAVLGHMGLVAPLDVNAKGGVRVDSRGYREIMTARQRDRVAALFAPEIEAHGYAF